MRLLPLAALLLPGCGYTVPRAPDAEASANAVSGEVLLLGPEPADVFILVYAADNPPPPNGFGRPVTFSSVPAERFSGAEAGAHAAPFTVSGLDDGAWLFAALVDVDGDFHPLVGSQGGGSCGDWNGAHVDVDATTGELAPAAVRMSGGELIDDIVIVASNPLVLERPVFALGEPGVPHTLGSGTKIPVLSAAIETDQLDLGPVMDPAAPGVCETAFAKYVWVGPGGLPDDITLSPLFLFQPLEQPEGETWVIIGAWDPRASLTSGSVTANSDVPSFDSALDVSLVYAQVARADGTTATGLPVTDAPRGAYSVTAMNVDGQTWTVPNDTADAPPSGEFDPTGQGVPIVFE